MTENTIIQILLVCVISAIIYSVYDIYINIKPETTIVQESVNVDQKGQNGQNGQKAKKTVTINTDNIIHHLDSEYKFSDEPNIEPVTDLNIPALIDTEEQEIEKEYASIKESDKNEKTIAEMYDDQVQFPREMDNGLVSGLDTHDLYDITDDAGPIGYTDFATY